MSSTDAAIERSTLALELQGISKQFGTLPALIDVGLSVSAGRVHALLGENGAGKSTLMRIAYGEIPADAGRVLAFGQRLARHSVGNAVARRVGMVHQQLSVIPNLTVVENVALGGRGVFRRREVVAKLEAAMESSGLRLPVDALARSLSIVEQQRLEILKALVRDARLLILDEPTAVLAPSDAEGVLRWIRAFADGGGSVILVTHKLREALLVADELTVLRRGRVVRSGLAAGTSERNLAEAMFPEQEDELRPTRPAAIGPVVVRAEGIDIVDDQGAKRIAGCSVQLRAGEIVGIAAVEGSGHRVLLGAFAGLERIVAGQLDLPQRIGVVPADRLRDAVIADFPLVENVALHGLSARSGRMPWDRLRQITRALVNDYGIATPTENAPLRTLSGGNQQRLVVARELGEDVQLVVADNPTRGLDVRATAFVHERLRGAAARGAVVILHSSDVDEVLDLADRVLVVFNGQVREVPLNRELVGRAMLGAA